MSVVAPGDEFVELRFGGQINEQALTETDSPDGGAAARHVAGYLAKYVTKSTTEFGVAPHRISPTSIDLLDVTEHVRRLLHILAFIATAVPDAGIGVAVDHNSAAAALGISPSRLRHHVRLGDLTPHFSGTKPIYLVSDLECFVGRLPTHPCALLRS